MTNPTLQPVLDSLRQNLDDLQDSIRDEGTTLARVWAVASELPDEQAVTAIAGNIGTLVAMATAAAKGDEATVKIYERALKNTLTGLRLRGAEQSYLAWERAKVSLIQGLARTIAIAIA